MRKCPKFVSKLMGKCPNDFHILLRKIPLRKRRLENVAEKMSLRKCPTGKMKSRYLIYDSYTTK